MHDIYEPVKLDGCCYFRCGVMSNLSEGPDPVEGVGGQPCVEGGPVCHHILVCSGELFMHRQRRSSELFSAGLFFFLKSVHWAQRYCQRAGMVIRTLMTVQVISRVTLTAMKSVAVVIKSVMMARMDAQESKEMENLW